MIYKCIHLKDEFPMLSDNVTLTSYCISNHSEFPHQRKRRTLLVIPGGGYTWCSEREAEPIAIKFLSSDINVFVLKYSCAPLKYPHPIDEGYAAIAYIRRHAEEYNVDVNHIGVVGFSAGGHFAATLSCYMNKSYYADLLNVKQEELKINGTILSYAVISNELSHLDRGTFKSIAYGDKGLEDYYSIEKHAGNDFPPTFIWTTKEDELVDYHNSSVLKERLDKMGVYNEFHLFDRGHHGGSTCDFLTNDERDLEAFKEASTWISKAVDFIYNKM